LKELTVKRVKQEEVDEVAEEESDAVVAKGRANYDAMRKELAANGEVSCPYEVRRWVVRCV
jgi:uncharacterized protein with ATP-grasp and redox domains